MCCCPSNKAIKSDPKTVSSSRRVARRQVMRHFTSNGTDQCRNGSTDLLTPYRATLISIYDIWCPTLKYTQCSVYGGSSCDKSPPQISPLTCISFGFFFCDLAIEINIIFLPVIEWMLRRLRCRYVEFFL